MVTLSPFLPEKAHSSQVSPSNRSSYQSKFVRLISLCLSRNVVLIAVFLRKLTSFLNSFCNSNDAVLSLISSTSMLLTGLPLPVAPLYKIFLFCIPSIFQHSHQRLTLHYVCSTNK